MEKFNPQIPVRYGLVVFAFVITIGLLVYVFYQTLVNNFLLYSAIAIIILLATLFMGIWSGISYRRAQGNVISYLHALLAVYMVFVFYSAGYTTSLLLVNKVIDTQYAEKLSKAMRDKMSDYFDKNNVPEDKAKEALDNMTPENFDPPMIKQAQSLGVSLLIGLVVAAIIAAFIKRGSEDLINTTTTSSTV